MRNRSISLTLCGVGVVVCFILIVRSSMPSGHSNIFGQDYDFGVVKRGAIVTKQFTLVNDSPNPWEIERTAVSCGCTQIALDSMHVEPGAALQVGITVDTSTLSGLVSQRATIFFNADYRLDFGMRGAVTETVLLEEPTPVQAFAALSDTGKQQFSGQFSLKLLPSLEKPDLSWSGLPDDWTVHLAETVHTPSGIILNCSVSGTIDDNVPVDRRSIVGQIQLKEESRSFYLDIVVKSKEYLDLSPGCLILEGKEGPWIVRISAHGSEGRELEISFDGASGELLSCVGGVVELRVEQLVAAGHAKLRIRPQGASAWSSVPILSF